MKTSRISSKLAVLSLLLMAGSAPVLAQGGSQAEAQRAGAAAREAQLAIEAKTPKLDVTEDILPLRIPGHTLGETEGVSKNKAGHLFVYSRTGFGGSSRGGGSAKLFEWDQNLKFVKEWLPDSYGASFAHGVRVDPEQNVWVIDEGSNTVQKVESHRPGQDGAGAQDRIHRLVGRVHRSAAPRIPIPIPTAIWAPSTAPPMWVGGRTAASTSPTATAIRGW